MIPGSVVAHLVERTDAPTCDERNFAFRNFLERFDHELLLSCPDAGLQIVEGVAAIQGTLHWRTMAPVSYSAST